MKHIKAFESFKKKYGEKIKQSNFKEIEIGKTVLYGSGRHTVVDNDGFILTLKDKDSKILTVNLNQFNDKGAIKEGRSIAKIEKDRTATVNSMAEIVQSWKSAKEAGDKEKEASFLQKLKELTAKKNSLEQELNASIADKDRFIELVITEQDESLAEGEAAIKSIGDHWFETYNEDFVKEYPKIAKIVKMHPNVDRRTLETWWNEIYDEDFKEKYPELWNKLA
jgi:hypothetical protein